MIRHQSHVDLMGLADVRQGQEDAVIVPVNEEEQFAEVVVPAVDGQIDRIEYTQAELNLESLAIVTEDFRYQALAFDFPALDESVFNSVDKLPSHGLRQIGEPL